VHDPTVICAALLHDTIEDTQTTPEELREIFGVKIARIVLEVTDDKLLLKAERKRRQIEHAPHLSRAAKLVKLADKICNLRDVAASPPPAWPLRRRRAYFSWAKKVVDGLRGASRNWRGSSTSVRRQAVNEKTPAEAGVQSGGLTPGSDPELLDPSHQQQDHQDQDDETHSPPSGR
jgi:hypothetical protein